jgi:single-stranded DNA-binding protein
MSSGATSSLWGFITSPDYKIINNSLPLLKFRLAFNRYDFQAKKNVTEFLPVTAFSKSAEKIFLASQAGMNYICCRCDIKVSSYVSKSGSNVQFQEHIISDFRMFSKQKAADPADSTDSLPNHDSSHASDHHQATDSINPHSSAANASQLNSCADGHYTGQASGHHHATNISAADDVDDGDFPDLPY